MSLLLDRNDNHIVTLTFNRPEARNAFTWAMQHEFLDTVKKLANDPDVRALILTGAGDQAFCAGGDLVELAAYGSQEDGAKVAAVMGEALDILENAPFPTIAAINGYALGGGAEIATACDLRIMAQSAKMGFVQVKMGLTPGWGAGQRLLRIAGYSNALEMLLSAKIYTADELLAKNIVNQVAPNALTAALKMAHTISNWDSHVVKVIKHILRNGLIVSYDQARDTEREAFPSLWAADAHVTAVEQFLKGKNK